jgi:hypothetical protein
LLKASPRPVASLRPDDDLVVDLLTICVTADVASAGMGLRLLDEDKFDTFEIRATFLNEVRHLRRNFCSDIDTNKLRVMPKLHTPQRGVTIRSLTHHLALIEPSEIELSWWGALEARGRERFDILNVLLLPWPMQISSEQFEVVEGATQHAGVSATRLFKYTPPRWGETNLKKSLRQAIDKAKADANRLHAIILPELSLNAEEYAIAEEMAIQERALLIAGVQMDDDGTPRNAAVAQPIGFSDFEFSEDDVDRTAADFLRIVQFKHHRWCLDRNQIIQYGLGGRLPASKDCWEDIGIEDRQLHFLTFAGWMTMSVLICEDLARQDPVSNALRAVAPGLVVALLMDGPQLQSRWSSRYATVLAEDPGCSVLTITSLGMSLRSKPSKPAATEDRSNVIALWRDPIHGAEEIGLAPGAIGCVLSLVCHTREEFTADGRGEGGPAYLPVFAGVQQVFR